MMHKVHKPPFKICECGIKRFIVRYDKQCENCPQQPKQYSDEFKQKMAIVRHYLNEQSRIEYKKLTRKEQLLEIASTY